MLSARTRPGCRWRKWEELPARYRVRRDRARRVGAGM